MGLGGEWESCGLRDGSRMNMGCTRKIRRCSLDVREVPTEWPVDVLPELDETSRCEGADDDEDGDSYSGLNGGMRIGRYVWRTNSSLGGERGLDARETGRSKQNEEDKVKGGGSEGAIQQ